MARDAARYAAGQVSRLSMRGFDRRRSPASCGGGRRLRAWRCARTTPAAGDRAARRRRCSQFRELEGSLKNTLVSAQRARRRHARERAQEAARIVREAEGRAELMMQKAQAQLEEAAARDRRPEDEAPRGGDRHRSDDLGAQHTLDFVREQDQRDRAGQSASSHRPTRSETLAEPEAVSRRPERAATPSSSMHDTASDVTFARASLRLDERRFVIGRAPSASRRHQDPLPHRRER